MAENGSERLKRGANVQRMFWKKKAHTHKDISLFCLPRTCRQTEVINPSAANFFLPDLSQLQVVSLLVVRPFSFRYLSFSGTIPPSLCILLVINHSNNLTSSPLTVVSWAATTHVALHHSNRPSLAWAGHRNIHNFSQIQRPGGRGSFSRKVLRLCGTWLAFRCVSFHENNEESQVVAGIWKAHRLHF